MQSLPSIHLPEITLDWADRLARSRMPAAAPSAATADAEHLAVSIARLWALFEDAVAQANQALARWNLEERLAIERTGSQRWISFAGRSARDRAISVLITAHARGGRIAGGALLATSQVRAPIYMSPALDAGEVRWVVPTTGIPFTVEMVHDLFLSVFGDDPVAAGGFAVPVSPVA